MTEFTKGDVVRLKSGGPKMTVVAEPEGAIVQCTWFDRNGKRHTDGFEAALLQAFVSRPPA